MSQPKHDRRAQVKANALLFTRASVEASVTAASLAAQLVGGPVVDRRAVSTSRSSRSTPGAHSRAAARA